MLKLQIIVLPQYAINDTGKKLLLIHKFPLVYHDTFVKVIKYQLLFGG